MAGMASTNDGYSTVDVVGGAIEYSLVGGSSGLPPLVFLHEGLGSIDLWRGVPAAVAERCGGPSVLVYSRHGYGQSAPAVLPRKVDYMHHEADVVLPEILDRLGIARPVLVGHSDGASIALLAAGGGMDVAGVVCLAPHVFVEPESIAGIEAARVAFEATDLVNRLGRYHADPVATFWGWNGIWLSAPFRSWKIESRLAGIAAPVLAIQGGADEYGTFDQLDSISRGVTGPVSQFRIAGAGHAPHLDARRLTVGSIAGFVGTLAVAR